MKKRYLVIDVKQKHINKGEQQNENTCAIAQCLMEQFGIEDSDQVTVTPDEIKIEKDNGFSFNFSWTEIPKAVQSFIERFDNAKDKTKVKPFKFRLPFIG